MLLPLLAIFCSVGTAGSKVKIDITGPSNSLLYNLSNLSIIATVTNMDHAPITLLRAPGTILFPDFTNNFDILHESGRRGIFRGIYVKFSPSILAKNSESLIRLSPCSSINITHSISAAYDLGALPSGSFQLQPHPNVYLVADDGDVLYSRAETSIPHRLTIIGGINPPAQPALSPRGISCETGIGSPFFKNCSSAYAETTKIAINGANQYVSEAFSYLQTQVKDSIRFTTWFGNYTLEKHALVSNNFEKLHSKDMYSTFTYDCGCEQGSIGFIAYVFAAEYGTIHLCPGFLSIKAMGTDSRAGSLIHESTHFANTISTSDYAYGQKACKRLAESDWEKAVENADSYEYFAENMPVLH